MRLGYIDDEYAYRIHTAKIIWLYKKFPALFKIVRELSKDNDIWIEMEKIAKEWENNRKLQPMKKRKVI